MRRKIKRKVLKAIALSFATAAVFAGAASGGPTSPESVLAEVPSDYTADWLAPGGVTPSNLARAYEPRFEGVARPDGYQPQLRGDQPLVIRDAPDGFVPQSPPADVVSVSASSDGYDRDDLAIGFGLGLIMATACAAALVASRNRMRMAEL
jgi:hypothetical protein